MPQWQLDRYWHAGVDPVAQHTNGHAAGSHRQRRYPCPGDAKGIQRAEISWIFDQDRIATLQVERRAGKIVKVLLHG